MSSAIRWTILFAIIAAVGYMAGNLTQLILDKFALLLIGLSHPFSIVEPPEWLALVGIYAGVAVEMFVGGFLYFWIMEPDWRKAGATAWLLLTIVHSLFRLPPAHEPLPEMFKSVQFYVGSAIAFAGAMLGAWWGDENHTNLRIKSAIDSALGFIGL